MARNPCRITSNWDHSGVLVLDYAVDLPSGTAGQPTFWGQNYTTKSDPAFILPWRLDPEKVCRR